MLSGMVGNAILLAAGVISTAGAVLGRTGSFTPARTGAGVFTITIPATPQAECLKWLCSHTATVTCANFIDTSDTVKTANFTTDAGVATDAVFSFAIWQLVPSS